MIAVFDTNIVVDALNGVPEADIEYKRYERVLISSVTWMEVLIGEKGDDSDLKKFLETSFEIVPINLEVSEVAVKLRRLHNMKLPDAIVMATAQVRKVELVTRDTGFKLNWGGIRVPYTLTQI